MDERTRRRSSGNSTRPNPSKTRPNPNAARKKVKSKRRRKRNLGFKVFIIVILSVCVLGAALLWTKYGPSKEKADLNKYYGIENENQLATIVNNEVLETHGMVLEGHTYIEYAAVRDYLNERFYWDPNENILLYTLPQDMITVAVGSKDYTISKEKKSEDYVILKTEGSTAYIALDFVQKYTNLEYKVYKNPNRVMIVNDWGQTTVATVKKNTQVRYRAGVKSPILTDISKKSVVTVIEKEGDWKKVRTKDGYIGYVKSSALKGETKKKISRDFKEEEFTNISKDYTINLAWHQVTSQAANNSVLETIAKAKGLTTLSPTWFSVSDNSGNLSSIASSEYVNYAHQSNIEVWGLIDNFSENVDSFELLSHTSSRENLTNQLVSEALQTGLDGINVDFENISKEAGEHYIQFIRELSVKCRKNGLVLSVDNYVPKGYTSHYHRKEQGIVADYLIIMGYDEHFSGSYESGSVASIDFVKEGIEATLKEVPANKVINAVPFYTRLWKETPKTEGEIEAEVGTEAEKYTTKVSSEAMGMSNAAQRVANVGAEITWDDKTQQNYAQWETEGVTYKIWLEDAASIEAKLKLMKENKLAGTAGWKLGFETSDIWELILKYVN
ncbi:MAG: glycosyl hydrolase family 18 protein [Lachnospiraceae bacterium]